MADRTDLDERKRLDAGGNHTVLSTRDERRQADRGGQYVDSRALDEREKFDHSDHPVDRSQPGDLHAPHSDEAEPPPRTRDSRAGVHQKEPVIPPDSRHDSNR